MLKAKQKPSVVATSVNNSVAFTKSLFHETVLIFRSVDPVKFIERFLIGFIPTIGQIVIEAKGISQILMNFSENDTMTGAVCHLRKDP